MNFSVVFYCFRMSRKYNPKYHFEIHLCVRIYFYFRIYGNTDFFDIVAGVLPGDT